MPAGTQRKFTLKVSKEVGLGATGLTIVVEDQQNAGINRGKLTVSRRGLWWTRPNAQLLGPSAFIVEWDQVPEVFRRNGRAGT